MYFIFGSLYSCIAAVDFSPVTTVRLVDDVTFSHSGLVERVEYSLAATEQDKHNKRDFKQILLNDTVHKYSFRVVHRGEVCCL